jgi:hypothetical protein
MGLVATNSGKSFTPAPAGTHLAICCQVIDLGTQYSEHYKKSQHKVLIGWELPDEKNEEGEPFMVWKRYTVSLNEKATLAQHLTSWRGRAFTDQELKGFKIANILGKPCLLNITHEDRDGSTYATVKAVMAPPKGTVVPPPTHPHIVFDLDNWDQALFDTFKENLQKTINSSEERQKVAGLVKAAQTVAAGAGGAPDEDDIPF